MTYTFNYINCLNTAITKFIEHENKRKNAIEQKPIELDNNLYDMFFNAISVYEQCIKDFFIFYEIDTNFLLNKVIFSIDSFPWVFNYIFNNGVHSISITVNINYSEMTVTFSTIKCRYTEGNIIFVNSIPDKYLRKINLEKLPILSMIEHQIPSKKRNFPESTLFFTLKYKISENLYEKLHKFNKFVDKNII